MNPADRARDGCRSHASRVFAGETRDEEDETRVSRLCAWRQRETLARRRSPLDEVSARGGQICPMAASRIAMAWSTSWQSMFKGGMNRIVFGGSAFTKRPCSRQASTTARATGTVNSTATRSPRPRTALIISYFSCRSTSRSRKYPPHGPRCQADLLQGYGGGPRTPLHSRGHCRQR